MVAAVADNGVIGADGDIPWRIPDDFAHFKRTTLGQVLVMGRATFESIGRPLPGRTTVVLRFTKKARRQLRSARRVKLKVAIRLAGTTRRLGVTLKR